MSHPPLSWLGIVRLGLVQTALGAIVILTTSTMNRVMVVELGLAAVLPGLLVGLHYAVQLSRPRMGYGSDMGRRRTPWIIGGMAVLGLGAILASLAVLLMAKMLWVGIGLSALAFGLIGAGVGASGTSLLVMLAKQVDDQRRAAAATIVWVMMIAGFIVTAAVAGQLLDPFSLMRLVSVTTAVSAIALVLTCVAVIGIERAPTQEASSTAQTSPAAAVDQHVPFATALREVWDEPRARRFAIFVFVSMLAYSAQDLILEPYAGLVFGLTPGESTKLAGVQHGGVLLGMILVGVAGLSARFRAIMPMRNWTIAGCIASALCLGLLITGGLSASTWPLKANVFALGFANGVYAVSAIGSMMGLVSDGKAKREGTRMGIWGAAQAIAFGFGGIVGTMGVDLMGLAFADPVISYGSVFALEALMFLVAARLAVGVHRSLALPVPHSKPKATPVTGLVMEG